MARGSPGPVETGARGGGEPDCVVAGGRGLDAGDDLVQPIGDGAFTTFKALDEEPALPE